MSPTRAACRVLALGLCLAAAADAAAADLTGWRRATGEWAGARTALADHGVHLDLFYIAEAFVRDDRELDYGGTLDFTLHVDTAAAGLWRGGTMLLFAEQHHGEGPSDDLGLVMPVSNYEAPDFTQVSELWLHQEMGAGFALRLGKQDANNDFAMPRFVGNFVNSSYGVLPLQPMPSYPASALGVAAFTPMVGGVGLRAGVYEGEPQLESFEGGAFEDGSGVFTVGEVRLEKGKGGPFDFFAEAGGWHHSAQERSGGFALGDLMVALAPSPTGTPRSVQFFLRTAFEPGADAPWADWHVGAGATLHGFVGEDNTLGVGTGWVSLVGHDEAFVEFWFKWRVLEWFALEPDVQLYGVGGDFHAVWGLRTRLKL